ncbi:asparagine synthetase [glutamine-hydrolyzing] 1 [Holospora obtusa F1]|uniref:asparagine synthase (glutamine-hydrolyzing) n=1 Tax=Holospora obtusa F1 TaxID=1399147 RepID=W6TIE0_HOLOB|nr:asparagine synthase (glutamine-hydrolyzing) [Holospora obtusa]ETZ07785.1 asparagine synthetase [glutamine-hydrolyzing] 1 [Holospora obtusa F1]
MCGIAGIWDLNKDFSFDSLQSFAIKASKALDHRGPDDSGIWRDENAGIILAHRRLAILDLSPNGHQPMVSFSGRYVIVYNGEIYNALDYRKNFSFLKSTSDTEILLHACEAWGPVEACRRFRGMFAFALWDKFSKTLYLARDRVGEKPLYWGKIGTMVVFSSELKSLHHCPGWKGTLCEKAMSSFFHMGYVVDPFTIYEGFQKLVPGTVLEISWQGTETLHCFWDHFNILQNTVLSKRPIEKELQTLEELLIDNVQRRMTCDVPFGVFLSGGIDSGLVTAMMQCLQKKDNKEIVRSFSVGFNIKEYNEAPNAESIAYHVGTLHKTFYMTGQDALTVLSEAYWDEPFADGSQLATAFLCKQVKNHGVTVCLSGDGGDESFAGYNRYLWIGKLVQKLGSIPVWMRKLVSIAGLQIFSGYRYKKLTNMLQILGMDDLWDLYHSVCLQHPIKNFWKKDLEPLSFSFSKTQLWDPVASMQYWDILSYLPGDILTKVDRASMAYSLEVRSPFLDHTVIEYGWTLPLHYRIYRGNAKYLLRQLALKWLPKFIAQDKKKGFRVPLGHWLRTDLRPWVESLLITEDLENLGFHSKAIQKLWCLHIKEKADYGYRLWNTIMFLNWYKNRENYP